jgi:hypothetical protein
MIAVAFNGSNVIAAQRCEFIADATGPGKKVEYSYSAEIKTVEQYIKEGTPGQIGGRPGIEVFGNNRPSTAQFTVDYSHLARFIRLAY